MSRVIDGDEHYNEIGFGNITTSAANVFVRAQIANLINPTIVIEDTRKSIRQLSIEIDSVLVWDLQAWMARTNAVADITASEGVTQVAVGGVTKDNTSEISAGPTADSIAQGTQPGGNGAAVNATGTQTTGQTNPRFVARFETEQLTNEENATGEINYMMNRLMKIIPGQYQPNPVDGNTFYYMMTAAFYHLWIDSAGLGAVHTINLGGVVRRVEVDFKEVIFDRETLFSVLDALASLT